MTATSRRQTAEMLATYCVGSVWSSEKYGDFTILEFHNRHNIVVRWHNNCKVQGRISTQNIRLRNAVNRTLNPPTPKTKGHYIYFTSVNGEIVYIGCGTGDRYLHTISGCSGNRELNRLYFANAPMITEVYAQGLSKKDAHAMERRLIATYKPKCNERVPKT